MSSGDPSLPGLVTRAQGGDHAAFSELVQAFEPRLRCLVHLRLGAKLRRFFQVEDVFQDVLLRAFRALPDHRWVSERSFHQWLASIAEHVIQDLFRRTFRAAKRNGDRLVTFTDGLEGKVQPAKLRDSLERTAATPSRILRRVERFERLESAVEALAPDRREAVILALVQELPLKTVAARMERSPEAVSMLLCRALAQLKSLLGSTESFGLPDVPLGLATRPVERPAGETIRRTEGR